MGKIQRTGIKHIVLKKKKKKPKNYLLKVGNPHIKPQQFHRLCELLPWTQTPIDMTLLTWGK